MATVQKFEDMMAWKKARVLVKEVYGVFNTCSDKGFTDQVQRASVSVLSNIAEGFESGTKQEFLNYLYIAKASAGEVRAQLYVAHDIGYLNVQEFKRLKVLAEECSKLITKFIQGLKGSKFKGLQHKKERTKDPVEEIVREYPEMYEKFYGKK